MTCKTCDAGTGARCNGCRARTCDKLQTRLLVLDRAIEAATVGCQIAEDQKSLHLQLGDVKAMGDAEMQREELSRKRSLLQAERQRTLIELCSACPDCSDQCRTLGPFITPQPAGQKALASPVPTTNDLARARKALRVPCMQRQPEAILARINWRGLTVEEVEAFLNRAMVPVTGR